MYILMAYEEAEIVSWDVCLKEQDHIHTVAHKEAEIMSWNMCSKGDHLHTDSI